MLETVRDPIGSIRLALSVLGAAVLGWIGVIALHAALMTAPISPTMAALPVELRGLVRFCGHAPDLAGTGFFNWMLGWALMVIAMMLPPALPLLRAGLRLLAGHGDGRRALLVMLGAFVAIWIAAGAVLFAGGTLLRAGLRLLPIGMQRADLASGLAAIAAGLFQFSSLKIACMDACRSPTALMMLRWQDARLLRSSLDVGARYGVICVGCCWATMLLAVLVGALMLPIMVAAALFMTLERLLPSTRRLIPMQAGFAIVIGMLLLTGAVPPAFF